MFHLLLNETQDQPKGLREQSSACTMCMRICCESATSVLLLDSITTAIFGCLILRRLEHSGLSVFCFPSYCLLIPLMSAENRKCGLVDWLQCSTGWVAGKTDKAVSCCLPKVGLWKAMSTFHS